MTDDLAIGSLALKIRPSFRSPQRTTLPSNVKAAPRSPPLLIAFTFFRVEGTRVQYMPVPLPRESIFWHGDPHSTTVPSSFKAACDIPPILTPYFTILSDM